MPTERTTLEIDGRPVRVSNLDKVLYPEDGTTKHDVIEHYLTVSPVLLPQLAGRPLTRKRWPNGVTAEPFFEKNARAAPLSGGAPSSSTPRAAPRVARPSPTPSSTGWRRCCGWPTWPRWSCTSRSGR